MKRQKGFSIIREQDGIFVKRDKDEKTVKIGAGTSDKIALFQWDGSIIAVLSYQERLGYAGMELIDIEEQERIEGNSCFFQNIDELNENLKKDFFDYSEPKQADILAEYIY